MKHKAHKPRATGFKAWCNDPSRRQRNRIVGWTFSIIAVAAVAVGTYYLAA